MYRNFRWAVEFETIDVTVVTANYVYMHGNENDHHRSANGTRKIRNHIAERGGQAVGDEEGTMGWERRSEEGRAGRERQRGRGGGRGRGGRERRGRRRKTSCRVTHVHFLP